jgi:hypothetical protein
MSESGEWGGVAPGFKQIDLRTDTPHSARIYDYMLGGKDNFAPDRIAAEKIAEQIPNLRMSMLANRRFLARIAHYMAADLGIKQFLDIGTGLPTAPNLHEVVQEVDPTSRVVYVDNDPIVLVHARALLVGTSEGLTTYLDADLHDPAGIFDSAPVRETLNLEQPVGLSLIAILQFIEDDDEVRAILRQLLAPLPPGSALALSTVTGDFVPEQIEQGVAEYRNSGIPTRQRTRAEVEAFLTGLDVVDPGVVLVHRWHPDAQEQGIKDEQVYMYGALAIKR